MSEDPRVCWSGSEIKSRLVSTCAASLRSCEHPGPSLLVWGLFIHWCPGEDHRKTLPWAEVHWRCPQINPHVCFHKILSFALQTHLCSSWAQNYFNLNGKHWFPDGPRLPWIFCGKIQTRIFWWGHKRCLLLAEQLDSEHQLQSPQSFQKVFCTKQGFWVVFLATLQISMWYILDLPELLWTSTVPCQVLFLSYVQNWRNRDPITAHKLIRGTTAADHHADLTWEG